jgi:hypothetical protein
MGVLNDNPCFLETAYFSSRCAYIKLLKPHNILIIGITKRKVAKVAKTTKE